MARMGPGFRFHPTDEELVVFYLKRKMTGNLSRYDHIAVVDVYKLEPWDLPSLSKLKTKDLEWYFFSALDRKYGNGYRTNRATERGYWNQTGIEHFVHADLFMYLSSFMRYVVLALELDWSGIIDSDTLPSLNFHYGECSSHAEYSKVFIKDQEPLADTFEISCPENVWPLDMTGQHGVGTNSGEDGDSGELSNIGNFDLSSNNMNLDLYWDANENLPMDDDGFLEYNDIAIGNGDNPTEADLSANAMLDEYAALADDDIYKYISFDSPQIQESENFIPNQGSPFTQQNVEGETADRAVVSNEGSSVQNTQEAMLGISTNPLVKQAYGWLASIPAAPAHAMEFPAKEIALGLHPVAQSSHPAHITTTGMISITDITFRDNAMDWTMGKNGGFSTVISTGFSQSDVNSAALMPVSGKTAFVLSHGWIFLTGFSVLILSLSCKIGSIIAYR
uniref:NAC domain-containing protein n=1 Tax=Glycine max TaxID=3847 RepID=A0A368UHL5_SOYBN